MQTDPIGYKDDMNLYGYVGNDPMNNFDPTGEGAVGTAIKFIIKGGDVGLTVAGVVEDYGTLTDSNASTGSRIWAGISLVSEALPISARDVGDSASWIASKLRKSCCFVAGTKVVTKEGLTNIEDIKVGDLVLSRDTETGQQEWKPVAELIRRHDRIIWELKVSTESGEEQFRTTDDHPWWVSNKGWKRTDELKQGMSIATDDGDVVSVDSIVNTAKPEFTYNIEVADFHTYFVGESHVLVNNACGPALSLGGMKLSEFKKLSGNWDKGSFKSLL